MYKRETVHVSLGSTANAVTAHLLNLEGLAATCDNDSCDPDVTHTIHNECYVPRVLMVDEPSNFGYRTTVVSTVESNSNHVATWDGSVERVRVSKENEEESQEHHATASMHDTASKLAHSAYSRYRAPVAQQPQLSFASNERHMKWDDEEEEEEEEEDEQEKRYRLEREQHRWDLETKAPLEEELDTYWTQKHNTSTELSWMDYWMPPYPSSRSYAAPLPFSQPCHQGVVDTWDSFVNGVDGVTAWQQDVLFEKFRHLLEACDAVQGFTVVTEGWGVYAGLATALLQEMQEESRAAGRFVFHVAEPYHKPQVNSVKDLESSATESWQPAHVQRVRRNLQTGLAFHGLATNSHVTLPLALDNSQSPQHDDTLFSKSAMIAMALEAATLPYRMSGSKDSSYASIGLNGYFGGSGRSWKDSYGTTSRLSFGEFIACLKPSSQHVLLNLDACMSNPEGTSLSHLLQVGTSIEQQRMERMGGRNAMTGRPRIVEPGAWMQHYGGDGILRSLSPQSDLTDRRLHRHFSLSASLRPDDNNTHKTSVPDYVTSLMESMGIGYQPEVSLGTVMDQSVTSLTQNGYGAGAYWKRILSGGKERRPVLSVVGNTTRIYPYLASISRSMKKCLSHKYMGYHNRDVSSGVLPEADDCSEALDYCLDVRDSYQPPDGSGLVLDSEGSYFDTSTD